MPLAMAKKCELVWANKHTQCETAMATSLSPSVWLTPPSQKAIYLAAPQLSFSLSVTHSLSLSLIFSLSLQLKNIFVMVTQHLFPCIYPVFFSVPPWDFCHPVSLEQFASCSPSHFRFYLVLSLSFSSSSCSAMKSCLAVNLLGP